MLAFFSNILPETDAKRPKYIEFLQKQINYILGNNPLGINYVVGAEEILKYAEKNSSIFLWNTLNYVNQKEKVRPYGYYNSLMNYFTWKVFTFFCFLLL